MQEFTEVAKINDFKPGTMRKIIIDEHEYLLVMVQDKFYATDNRCPHMGGNLSMGKLDGIILTCPRHYSQFDLTDGHVVRWTDWVGIKLGISKLVRSPRPIHTYEVKVEGDKIMLRGVISTGSNKV
jgi:3-phenylpropionate/trans-cinnamate dioxygenase ferredoxin component